MRTSLLGRGKRLPCILFSSVAAPALNLNQSVCERICLSKWKEAIFSFRFLEVIKPEDAVKSKSQGARKLRKLRKKRVVFLSREKHAASVAPLVVLTSLGSVMSSTDRAWSFHLELTNIPRKEVILSQSFRAVSSSAQLQINYKRLVLAPE